VIAGEGTEIIERPVEDCWGFVLDFERYMRADTKIARVDWIRWDGDRAEIRYAGKLRGLPASTTVQVIDVQPHRRIDVRSKPGTPQHAACRFHGWFTFDDLGDGRTRVTHREEFDFRPPLRWLVEPRLRDWLAEDTRHEVTRMKEMLEAGV
jgi:hypothetical protein